MNRKSRNILLRLSVIFIFHLLFKQGDQSFSGAFEPSLRSLVFSMYFITYWMVFWEVCRFILKKLNGLNKEKKKRNHRFLIVPLILLFCVSLCSVIFNWGYTLINQIFGISAGSDLPLINPEIFKTPGHLLYRNLNPELLFGFILFFFLVYGAHLIISSVRNAKDMELLAAEKERENLSAQYTALKNQIDPHFFFNSLSVLSSLIYENTELSAEYISHMSKHYRYILETSDTNLVSLSREMDYLDSYFYMMNIRYPDSIVLVTKISDHTKSECKILPHTLLMLVENAIKHNMFSREDPCQIDLHEDDKYIIVSNKIKKRKQLRESTGIGLQNIRKRYRFESNREVLIEESEDHFVVKLPKI